MGCREGNTVPYRKGGNSLAYMTGDVPIQPRIGGHGVKWLTEPRFWRACWPHDKQAAGDSGGLLRQKDWWKAGLTTTPV